MEDKWIDLESAVRYMLGLESGTKSTNRMRRVCSFTCYLTLSASPTDSILGDSFHVSEPVATFILIERRVALAVVQVTNMNAEDGRMVESISEKHFSSPASHSQASF